MSCGEKAEVTIEPEWAYGKKGVEGKYPFQTNYNAQVLQTSAYIHICVCVYLCIASVLVSIFSRPRA